MITLKSTSQTEATILSNIFIDRYMPEANGEFVKVYIYLVRTLSSAPVSFSLEQMADHLLCTERDILRALKYWDNVGLLSLVYDAENVISDIILTSPSALSALAPGAEQSAASSQNPVQAAAQPASSVPVSPISSSPKSPENTTAASPKSAASSLSPDRIKELKQNEEIVQLLYIAEQYLGKVLTSTEMQKILFFYDELKMSSVLIEFLIEYCVSKNHRSIRYMEKVALAWAENGITTVEEAKASSSLYIKDYFTILKYLGISGSNPADKQIEFMDTWLKTYGFSMEIIHEACNRTKLKTGQPSFEYTDSILKHWHKQGIQSLAEIQALDEEHKKNKAAKAQNRSSKKSSAPNRFNNFSQREYDFKEYEKRFFNQ